MKCIVITADFVLTNEHNNVDEQQKMDTNHKLYGNMVFSLFYWTFNKIDLMMTCGSRPLLRAHMYYIDK